MPISLTFFAITAVIYILQLIPTTGVFLMMLAAPFWSIATINAGFIGLLIEAGIGRISRIWLLAPALWFGGYALATTLSHMEFAQLNTRIAQENADVTLPFSPDKEDLAIRGTSSSLSWIAASLVQSYDLPVVFETVSGEQRASHRAHRLGSGATCTQLEDSVFRSVRIYKNRIRENDTWVDGMCHYSMLEDPQKPLLTIESRKEEKASYLLPHTLDHITLHNQLGNVVTVTSGVAYPLRWLPMPVLGCALNSARPAWECISTFLREPARNLEKKKATGTGAVHIVARALNLKHSPASERKASLETQTAAQKIDSVASDEIAISIANLDLILADPKQKFTIHDLRGLSQRPDLLSPRAKTMVETFGRALNEGPRARESALILQSLLINLPHEDFRSIGPALITSLSNRPHIESDPIKHNTLVRIGDLGEPALPVLERFIDKGKPALMASAMEGLCRLGAPAAGLADRTTEKVVQSKNANMGQARVGYVLMMRLGRPDLADRLLEPAKIQGTQNFDHWSRATPASPPSVCISSSGRPSLPAPM